MQVKNTDIIVFRGDLQTLRLSEIGVSVVEVFACGGDAAGLAEPARGGWPGQGSAGMSMISEPAATRAALLAALRADACLMTALVGPAGARLKDCSKP